MSLYFGLKVTQTQTFPCQCLKDDTCLECKGTGTIKLKRDIASFNLGNCSDFRKLRGDITEDKQQFGTNKTSFEEIMPVLLEMAPLAPDLRATLHFLIAITTMQGIKLTLDWS